MPTPEPATNGLRHALHNRATATGTPAVSVLLPVYNAQRYVATAIESVLTQSFDDFELILIDDGSMDHSLGILREFEQRDDRVRVISRPNTGIVGALNDGLAAARGEFIARMDADDLSLPARFQMQVQFLREHLECVLVGSRVMLIDPDGSPICEWAKETTHEEIDGGHLALRWPVVHPAVMMRRDVLNQVGGYRKQYNTLEDLDLFLRLAEQGRLANLPVVLLHYRQHFGSTCFSRNGEQSDIREAIYKETFERRGLRIPGHQSSESFRAVPRNATDERRRWSWMALEAGHVATARKHALRVARSKPLDKESWRLLYCAMRGH